MYEGEVANMWRIGGELSEVLPCNLFVNVFWLKFYENSHFLLFGCAIFLELTVFIVIMFLQ